MPDLRILSTLGVMGVMQEVMPALGTPVSADFAPTAALVKRIEAGESADIAILTAEGIEALTASGVLVAGTRLDLANSFIGFAVRPGMPKPDMSSAEAVKRTLLAVPSLCYSRAGASGIYFADLIERLGIAAEVNAKAIVIPQGFTGEKLKSGEVELAVQQVSELMAVPGIDIAGKLPPEIETVATFSGAIFAASPRRDEAAALLRQLHASHTPALLRAKGLEPA